jgi:cytochrome P450
MSSAMAASAERPSFGLLNGAVGNETRDPYPEFARLRRESPIVRHEPVFEGAPVSFVLYRHADITRVLRDGVTFSSSVIAQGMRDVWGRRIIVGMDAPEHQRHRALVSVAFRQRTLARWEESLVGRIVNDLIDQFIDRGHVDLVTDYTFEFPARVMSGVLGLPEEDFAQFQRWAIGIITVFRDWDNAIRCSAELTVYLSDIIEARRVEPRHDLITDLVNAELDGAKLDDEEIYSFLRMLLPAGIETTYRSSGNLLHLLLTHPEQLEAIRADRSLLPQAIEEGLRFESPILLTPRFVTTDTELSGVPIPAGSTVTAMVASANRDPAVYPAPETFDIFRDPKQHMSFGTGPHLCLGMHLARMETRIAVDALLDRLPGLRLDADEATRSDVHIQGDSMFRNPTALPITWQLAGAT